MEMTNETKKLTTEEFLALPDREKDALVAKKVMGVKIYHPVCFSGGYGPDDYIELNDDGSFKTWISLDSGGGGYCRVRHYTTGISAAGWVVEKMRSDGWCMSLKNMCGPDCVGVTFKRDPAIDDFDMEVSARAATAPLSIAICALKAVGAIE